MVHVSLGSSAAPCRSEVCSCMVLETCQLLQLGHGKAYEALTKGRQPYPGISSRWVARAHTYSIQISRHACICHFHKRHVTACTCHVCDAHYS
jgi:hypothetical protein